MKLPLPKNEPQQRRLELWEMWLVNFRKEQGRKIKYIPNAAWLLNDLYWRLVEQYLRPVLENDPKIYEKHRIHQYKIISASEITVMMVEPIEVDKIKSKQYNAALAWFIATSIIESWDTGDSTPITVESINLISRHLEHIDKVSRYPESFAAEHMKWLSQLNVAVEKPLLLNAQCWRLFYLTCLAVEKSGKLK